mmetsp:Transcript_16135/g.46674  ORF Transcript_16135/g.46674 Transcript_16135/m.46674 type:complete len:281 (+) Transcript_16135:52-894(+)
MAVPLLAGCCSQVQLAFHALAGPCMESSSDRGNVAIVRTEHAIAADGPVELADGDSGRMANAPESPIWREARRLGSRDWEVFDDISGGHFVNERPLEVDFGPSIWGRRALRGHGQSVAQSMLDRRMDLGSQDLGEQPHQIPPAEEGCRVLWPLSPAATAAPGGEEEVLSDIGAASSESFWQATEWDRSELVEASPCSVARHTLAAGDLELEACDRADSDGAQVWAHTSTTVGDETTDEAAGASSTYTASRKHKVVRFDEAVWYEDMHDDRILWHLLPNFH